MTSHPNSAFRRAVLIVVGAAALAACTADDPGVDAPPSAAAPEPSRTPVAATAAAPPPTLAPPTTTPPSVPDAVYGPGWSSVHADAANSDYSQVTGPRSVELAWERVLDGDLGIGDREWTINLGPTSDADGHVYVTSSVAGCHLQQLDLSDGATRWCAADVRQAAIGSSALLDVGGRAYLGDGEFMRAFDDRGRVLWEQPIVGVPFSAQFTPGGNVVLVTHLGVVYVLDRRSGSPVIEPVELVPNTGWDPSGQVWACARGTEACPSANTIAVDIRTGTVYFTWWEPGHPQAGLRAMRLDEAAGTLTDLWMNETLPGGSASSPTLSADGARVYVTDNVDSIHAIDTATGATVWTHPIGIATGGSLSLSPDGVMIPAGGPLVGVRDSGDRAEEVWRHDELINVGIATQAAGGTAYATVAAGGGRTDLVVLDTTTGDVLDREPLEGTTRFSVGITLAPDGTVLVPMIGGELLAYRPGQ